MAHLSGGGSYSGGSHYGGSHFAFPLSEDIRRRLIQQGVPPVFTTDF